MSNRYIPHTEEDISAMLEKIGVTSARSFQEACGKK